MGLAGCSHPVMVQGRLLEWDNLAKFVIFVHFESLSESRLICFLQDSMWLLLNHLAMTEICEPEAAGRT